MTRVVAIVGVASGAGDAPASVPQADRAAVHAASVVARGGAWSAVGGRGDAAALRYAAAAGASEARATEDVSRVEFDVAIVGAGARAELGDLLPARLAERRRAAMVVDVLAVEVLGDALRVTRDLAHGSSEVLRVTTPTVLVMADDAPTGRYVSRWRLNRANSASFAELLTPGERAVTGWEPVRPRPRIAASVLRGGSSTDRLNEVMGATRAAADSGEAASLVRGDASALAKHLLRYLAHHGFIRGSAGVGVGEATTSFSSNAESKRSQASSVSTDAASLGPTHARLARSPRGTAGASLGMRRRPRPLEQFVSAIPARIQRGPRSLAGDASGMVRRPRAVAFLNIATTNAAHETPIVAVARRPRPVGVASPLKRRGPVAFDFNSIRRTD